MQKPTFALFQCDIPALVACVEMLCEFNCDAESSCTCKAHLMYRAATAALTQLQQERDDTKAKVARLLTALEALADDYKRLNDSRLLP
jgi:hypothetical protein